MEWQSPASVSLCCWNDRQLALYLAPTRQLIYLELDMTSNRLTERKAIGPLPDPVLSMALGPVPVGRQRARHLSVGLGDCTLRIVSCDAEDLLEPVSLQALAATPTALLISQLDGEVGGEEFRLLGSLVIDVGLQNGVHIRLRLDSLTGALSEAQTHYLADSPITKMIRVATEGDRAAILVLLAASKPWLVHYRQQEGWARHSLVDFPVIADASSFTSAQCPLGGVVSLRGSLLTILSIDEASQSPYSLRNQRSVLKTSQTPRKLAVDPTRKMLAIVETDFRSFNSPERKLIEASWNLPESPSEGLPAEQPWIHLAPFGKWASLLRLAKLETDSGQERRSFLSTLGEIGLASDETATCVAFVTFLEHPVSQFIAVGVAKGMTVWPRACRESYLRIYAVSQDANDRDGIGITLVHQTAVDGIPSVLHSFGGRLLAGVGSTLRLYELGKKQLLRKCEIRVPTFATAIQTQGWRIFVGDAHESIQLLHYRLEANRFHLIADDNQLRGITTLCMLDYETVAVADRWGNFAVLRLSAAVSAEIASDSAFEVGPLARKEHLFGAPYKLERLAEFHLGDTITSITKDQLLAGLGRELILYTTISGAIGVFLPLSQRSDALILQSLEQNLRQETGLIFPIGRDHLAFRSAYVPVKSVIDGDLCETVLSSSLTIDRKHRIVTALDLSPADLLQRLREFRHQIGL